MEEFEVAIGDSADFSSLSCRRTATANGDSESTGTFARPSSVRKPGPSGTLEPMVLYRPLYNLTGMWVRPFDMFFELVEVDGVARPRFEKVEGPTNHE